jgi:hypothetical protein
MESAHYEIRMQGQLDTHWSEWFAGLAVASAPDGSTLLAGPIPDSAALFGVLERVRDLGLTLVSVQRIDST